MKKSFKASLALFILVAVLGCFSLFQNMKRTDSKKLVFADGVLFWTAPTLIANDSKLFEKQRLDVEIVRHTTGLGAKNAVVSKTADIGIVATTPIAQGLLQDEEMKIIATYMLSSEILKLVRLKRDANENGGEKSIEDFFKPFTHQKMKVGFVPGTISEQHLDNLESTAGVLIERVAIKPEQSVTLLEGGKLDAVSIWEPFSSMSSSETVWIASGENPLVSLHFVTRQDVIEEKETMVLNFLEAIDAACREIQKDGNSAKVRVERLTKSQIQQDVWDSMKFSVHANTNEDWRKWFTKELERDLKWSAKNSKTNLSEQRITELCRKAISTKIVDQLK